MANEPRKRTQSSDAVCYYNTFDHSRLLFRSKGILLIQFQYEQLHDLTLFQLYDPWILKLDLFQ